MSVVNLGRRSPAPVSKIICHKNTGLHFCAIATQTTVMKSILLSLALVAVVSLQNACSPITKVYSEEEPGINLYKYTTYSWLNNLTVAEGNSGPTWLSERAEQKIRNSVENEMRRYGFSVCEEVPDLMLHYHVVVKNEVFFIRDWWCDEETWSRYGRCNRIRPVNYQEGTLILDLIDAKTGVQVWRGAAVGVLEHIAPEQADARIEEAVRLIFTKFPQQPIPKV